jgi:hypothetical protein
MKGREGVYIKESSGLGFRPSLYYFFTGFHGSYPSPPPPPPPPPKFQYSTLPHRGLLHNHSRGLIKHSAIIRHHADTLDAGLCRCVGYTSTPMPSLLPAPRTSSSSSASSLKPAILFFPGPPVVPYHHHTSLSIHYPTHPVFLLSFPALLFFEFSIHKFTSPTPTCTTSIPPSLPSPFPHPLPPSPSSPPLPSSPTSPNPTSSQLLWQPPSRNASRTGPSANVSKNKKEKKESGVEDKCRGHSRCLDQRRLQC